MGFPPTQMTAERVIDFLDMDDIADSTRQARLTHLRRLLEALHAAYPAVIEIESMYKQVKLLKVRSQGKGNKRQKRALTPKEIYTVIDHWNRPTLLGKRNKALLSILFYCALRREEASLLRWSDIDSDSGLLLVREGKGDKERTIPILGHNTLDVLEDWWNSSGGEWLFRPIIKGDKLGKDKPISPQTIYDTVKATCKATGIAFSPHDGRRTAITRLLDAGTTLPDTRDFAGHASSSTTMNYAQRKDAQDLKGRLKLDY